MTNDCPDNVRAIQAELEAVGYRTCLFKSPPRGWVVSFPYVVDGGSHRGREVLLGISMGGDRELYPEYPPHWLHISPPINDGRGGTVEHYSANGRDWIALSRPPGAMWDTLDTKHMNAFVTGHVRRFWIHI